MRLRRPLGETCLETAAPPHAMNETLDAKHEKLGAGIRALRRMMVARDLDADALTATSGSKNLKRNDDSAPQS